MQVVRRGQSTKTKLHFTSCPFTTLLDLFEVTLGNLRDLVLRRSIALSNLGERTFCWDAPISGSLMATSKAKTAKRSLLKFSRFYSKFLVIISAALKYKMLVNSLGDVSQSLQSERKIRSGMFTGLVCFLWSFWHRERAPSPYLKDRIFHYILI